MRNEACVKTGKRKETKTEYGEENKMMDVMLYRRFSPLNDSLSAVTGSARRKPDHS